MAHFAELDSNNIVLRVLVVNNSMIKDEQGNEQEHLGIDFLKSLFGQETIWLQTSYNGNMRKNYAGIGYTYDAIRNAFIPPKPYPSWVLNEATCQWDAPVLYPTDDKRYIWNEEQLAWVEVING
jgi:hypothetical protein